MPPTNCAEIRANGEDGANGADSDAAADAGPDNSADDADSDVTGPSGIGSAAVAAPDQPQTDPSGIGSAAVTAPDQPQTDPSGIGSAAVTAPEAPQPDAPVALSDPRANLRARAQLNRLADEYARLERGKRLLHERAEPETVAPPTGVPAPRGITGLGRAGRTGAADAYDLAMSIAVSTSLQNGMVTRASYDLTGYLEEQGVPPEIGARAVDRVVGDVVGRIQDNPDDPRGAVSGALDASGDFPAALDTPQPASPPSDDDAAGVGGIGSAAVTAPDQPQTDPSGIGSAAVAVPGDSQSDDGGGDGDTDGSSAGPDGIGSAAVAAPAVPESDSSTDVEDPVSPVERGGEGSTPDDCVVPDIFRCPAEFAPGASQPRAGVENAQVSWTSQPLWWLVLILLTS